MDYTDVTEMSWRPAAGKSAMAPPPPAAPPAALTPRMCAPATSFPRAPVLSAGLALSGGEAFLYYSYCL